MDSCDLFGSSKTGVSCVCLLAVIDTRRCPTCSTSSSLLFLRYVDNRLLLGPTATLQSEQLKAFCDPHFYDGILLETVSDHRCQSPGSNF